MRILCLDDEPLALKMLEAAIREAKSDAEVTAFRKQADLLEDAKQNGCDVAFLDIHMRGMNGVEVAKRLKEINPKMNIIFVTGFSDYKESVRLHYEARNRRGSQGGTGGSALSDHTEKQRSVTRTVLRQL